jgi:hypothetical protein
VRRSIVSASAGRWTLTERAANVRKSEQRAARHGLRMKVLESGEKIANGVGC